MISIITLLISQGRGGYGDFLSWDSHGIRCANEEYEHREAQNSFDHQKWLTWAGVMIVGGVSFFLTRVSRVREGPDTCLGHLATTTMRDPY